MKSMKKYLTIDNSIIDDVFKEGWTHIYTPRKPYPTINPTIGRFDIRKVIFNDPATIVLWADGTKTIVKCSENDIYDPEKGLAMAISKKALGDKGNYYKTFEKHLPKDEVDDELVSQLLSSIANILIGGGSI